MMICKADFDELFPESFEPGETGIARSQRDYARIPSDPPGEPALRRARTQYDRVESAGTREALSTMPLASAYGAVWAMLATYDRMTRDPSVLANHGRR